MPPISTTSTPATRPIPTRVDAEWQRFFASLKDDARDVAENAKRRRPGSGRTGRCRTHGDLIAALDGQWAEVEQRRSARRSRRKAPGRQGVELPPADSQRATRDSIRALMLIRAYRMRGHFHANLDPLGLEPPKRPRRARSATYGFTDADLDRQIFLDNVLGLEFGTIRQIAGHPAPHLLPDARLSSSCTFPIRRAEGLDPGAHRGPDKEITFTPRRQARHPATSWSRPKASRNSATCKFTGTKRFGLDGGESMIPALEQIIKRGGALGVQGNRARHGPSRPAQRALPR